MVGHLAVANAACCNEGRVTARQQDRQGGNRLPSFAQFPVVVAPHDRFLQRRKNAVAFLRSLLSSAVNEWYVSHSSFSHQRERFSDDY